MSGEDGLTDDVKVMLGNPKKALIAMAIPIAVASLIQSTNSIIDTVWLTSIGVEAQAAVNVLFPIFFLTIGIGNGIAVGASQAVAWRIGAKDQTGANSVAVQAVVLCLLIGIILAIIFIIFAEQLIIVGGGGSNIDACMAYAIPIFIGFPAIMVSDIFSGLLRSEGSAKRAMYIMVVGAALNILLDPIFIFGLDLGITGAAIATTVSMSLPLLLVFYWYHVKKSTFIKISFKGFHFDRGQIWDILRVGIPASMELVLLSVTMMVMNVIIDNAASVDGVAIFGNGWKIMDLFFMPTMAIGFAVTPIVAAALGAKQPDRIKGVYRLALIYGVAISFMISAVLLLFSDYLVIPFSYSDDTIVIRDQMSTFLKICAVFMPFCPLGYVSSGYFQGLGWGLKSFSIMLVLNVLRIPICLFMTNTFDGLEPIWWGLVIAEIIGSTYGGIYGTYSVHKLLKGRYPDLITIEADAQS